MTPAQHSPYHRSINAEDWKRLHALARLRAQALRREAIDDFWRGVGAVFCNLRASARRRGERLTRRLAPAGAPSTHHKGV